MRFPDMSSFPKLTYACPIRWDEMQGDERERFCSRCARTVVNISLLTDPERRALLARTPPEQLCVSCYRRLTGESVSAERPLTPAESRSTVPYGVAALTVGALVLAAECLPAAGPVLQQTGTQLQSHYERARDELADDAQLLFAKVTGRPPPAPAAVIFLGMVACPPSPTPTSPPTPLLPSATAASAPSPYPSLLVAQPPARTTL